MKPDRLDAVTFDWWNTVARTTADQDRRLRDLRIDRLCETAVALAPMKDILVRAYDLQTTLLERVWARDRDLLPRDQIRAFLAFAGLDGEDPALVDRASEAFGGALLELPPALFPHVLETLETLKREGVAVGLVSNTGRTWGRYLRRVQDDLGIGRFFDIRVFSDEAGVRKPDPEIFRKALDGLGLPPERVAHVGDDVSADVAGATAIGMRAVWFNPDGNAPPSGGGASPTARDRADAEIHDHGELPEMVRRWRS